MTVIVWDGATLAADCQGCVGDMRVNRMKIRRRDDGAMGADARRAVEVANELCPGCGPGVQVEIPGMVPP
jgi:hypothetical protein